VVKERILTLFLLIRRWFSNRRQILRQWTGWNAVFNRNVRASWSATNL